jgi:hypothetical protein
MGIPLTLLIHCTRIKQRQPSKPRAKMFGRAERAASGNDAGSEARNKLIVLSRAAPSTARSASHN